MGKWWFLTVNNWTLEELDALWTYKSTYKILASEVGEQGTPHLHIVYRFHSDKQFDVLKKAFPRANIQKVDRPKNAIEYVKKTGKYFEEGVSGLQNQGKRNDLEYMATRIKNGADWEELVDTMPWMIVKFPKGIQKLMEVRAKSVMRENMYIQWIYGKAGVGKSRSVYDNHGIDNVYMKDGTPWWDGYQNQDVILIDDFDGRWPFRDLLRLLDRYPYQGQVKGGYVKITSSVIYITCDRSPQEVFNGDDINIIAQVLRRLTAVVEMKRDVSGNTITVTHIQNKNPENRNSDENI